MSTSPDATSLNISSLASARAKRQVSPLRSAPNLLTFLRICLLPILIMAVLDRRFELAFGLFLVAAVTDAMDGLLARWLRQKTMLGQYLDPVADKLLLSSLFLVLTRMGILEPQVTVIVFGRDLGMLMTAVILYRVIDLRDFHPTLLGKANSLSQVLAIGMVLLSLISQQPWVADARTVLLGTTIMLTVSSGFHYAWVASRRIGLLTDATASLIPTQNGPPKSGSHEVDAA